MKKENKQKDHLYYVNDPSNSETTDRFPNIIGWKVKASNDKVIGTVNQLVVSKDADKVVYLDIEVDKDIRKADNELYCKPSNYSGDFSNKKNENHLIIPIGMSLVNEEHKSIQTTEIDEETFKRTKRIKGGASIDREYELIILETYKKNPKKTTEKNINDKNKKDMKAETNTKNISSKKREKDPIRQKNEEELDNIQSAEEENGTYRPINRASDRKSGKDGVIQKIGKENELNKPLDTHNITTSPGEIVDDSKDIESEVDAKMRKEKVQKSVKSKSSTSKNAKSSSGDKKENKQTTMQVSGERVSGSKNGKSSSGSGKSSSDSTKSKGSSGSSSSNSSKSSSGSKSSGSRSSSDKGSYITTNYHEHTKEELYNRAQTIDLEGRSQMSKDELVNALYETHTRGELYDMASDADITGRSKMSKTELINALKRADSSKNSGNSSNSNSGSGRSGSSNKTSGSTKSSSSSSSSSTGTNYHELTRDELYEKAKQKDIEGRSQMSKDELIHALYEDHTREDLYRKATKANIKGRSKMSKRKLINELQKS